MEGNLIYREEGEQVACSLSYWNPSLNNKLGLVYGVTIQVLY